MKITLVPVTLAVAVGLAVTTTAWAAEGPVATSAPTATSSAKPTASVSPSTKPSLTPVRALTEVRYRQLCPDEESLKPVQERGCEAYGYGCVFDGERASVPEARLVGRDRRPVSGARGTWMAIGAKECVDLDGGTARPGPGPRPESHKRPFCVTDNPRTKATSRECEVYVPKEASPAGSPQ